MHRTDAENGVDLRHLLYDLVAVTLRQTSRHYYAAQTAVLLQPRHVENAVDGLPPRFL